MIDACDLVRIREVEMAPAGSAVASTDVGAADGE
jgi:hypothetical protein